jgi:hypothetical protein
VHSIDVIAVAALKYFLFIKGARRAGKVVCAALYNFSETTSDGSDFSISIPIESNVAAASN